MGTYNERESKFTTNNISINNRMIDKDIETDGGYTAKVSGNFGEYKISSVLSSLPEEYHIIDNVMLKTRKGTTQIDHIVVSKHGIFVIETKNHKGMIFGDANGKVWTQVLYNGRKNTFYSPVLQNEGHIEALCRAINIRRDIVIGFIVFTNEDARLDNVKCRYCLKTEQLFDVIISTRGINIMSDSQVWKAIRRIDRVNIDNYENRLKHIDYVKKQQGDKKRLRY